MSDRVPFWIRAGVLRQTKDSESEDEVIVSPQNIGSRRIQRQGSSGVGIAVLHCSAAIAVGGRITKMTVKTFCSSGKAEFVKGGVHAAAGAIVGVMAVYNGVAWCFRRERHLRWNTIFYTAALAFEIHQTRRHFKRKNQPEPLTGACSAEPPSWAVHAGNLRREASQR